MSSAKSPKRPTLRLWDFVAVWLIVATCVVLAEWRATHQGPSRWLKRDYRHELGGEYDEMAQALRRGRGLADPFREPSGPTAWMPPVLPLLLFAMYDLAGGDRSAVIEITRAIQSLVVVFTGLLVIWQARLQQRVVFGYLVFVTTLTANFFFLFQYTHDTWLVLLVINLLWLGLRRLREPPVPPLLAVSWGAFGGLAALCNPIVGAAWAVGTACIWRPRRTGVLGAALPLLLAAAVSILVVGPWTIRNRVKLGAWIPIKSNALYELWQSHCLDDDGVLDSQTIRYHPYASSGKQRRRYVEVGEIAFVAECGDVALKAIACRPHEYCARMGNRALAACLAYHTYSPEEELLIWPTRFKRAIFPLPLVSLVLLVLMGECRRSRDVFSAVIVYMLVLSPYIVIGYYDRYGVPLLGVKMLLVLYAVDAIGRWLSDSRKQQRTARESASVVTVS